MPTEKVDKKRSRWSTAKYSNLTIPSYIPPEAIVFEHGQFLRALLLRAQLDDISRFIAAGQAEEYFSNIPLEPKYDAQGNRTNTPENILDEKRIQAFDALSAIKKACSAATDEGKAGEIIKRIYFTSEQMETGAFGALIGARGSVHKQLQEETKCRIVLVGRGITNPLKDTSANAAALALEEPHVRITAQNEEDLQLAAERIEWILSDELEAVEFREKNKKRMAQVEGRYDPRTWVSGTEDAKKKMSKKAKMEEEEREQEVDDFLEGLE
ncbi:KH domain containing protein, putative [Angomonas deanei]|uniref:Branchpoint-bridging protein n=1 Tax=Angomonas deanei TaxID=59799 RepID=A0A7G2C0C9_9TRYP|nr:KH domain containing protein, putative [Angomonas deanei]